MKNGRMSSTDRAEWVAGVLKAGRVLTPAVMAEYTGISRVHASQTLKRLAVTMPIVNQRGLWYWRTAETGGGDD